MGEKTQTLTLLMFHLYKVFIRIFITETGAINFWLVQSSLLNRLGTDKSVNWGVYFIFSHVST